MSVRAPSNLALTAPPLLSCPAIPCQPLPVLPGPISPLQAVPYLSETNRPCPPSHSRPSHTFSAKPFRTPPRLVTPRLASTALPVLDVPLLGTPNQYCQTSTQRTRPLHASPHRNCRVAPTQAHPRHSSTASPRQNVTHLVVPCLVTSHYHVCYVNRLTRPRRKTRQTSHIIRRRNRPLIASPVRIEDTAPRISAIFADLTDQALVEDAAQDTLRHPTSA